LGAENPSSTTAPVCPDSGSQWCEQFGYDIYGNRAMVQTSFTGLVTPQGFSTATNRITDSGWSYDGAGNVNHDPTLGVSYEYDAENRLVAACTSDAVSMCTNQAGAGRTLYGYDGSGRRVTKQTASGQLVVYVYDAAGQLTVEYRDPTGGGTEYLTADHLGSTRVVTNVSMGVVGRHDFRPFGDEVTGTAARSGVVGYGSDGAVAQKYTSKERDAETGLDWFESRYYSSAQGRFTSPDEFKGGFLDAFSGQAAFQAGPLPYADISDPQTLNKYAYVRNNPLRYTDPNGHCLEDACIGEAILAYTAATAVAGGAIYYAQKLTDGGFVASN
jgi:RHS repeat-associated protein